jgi:hypothetical protein
MNQTTTHTIPNLIAVEKTEDQENKKAYADPIDSVNNVPFNQVAPQAAEQNTKVAEM